MENKHLQLVMFKFKLTHVLPTHFPTPKTVTSILPFFWPHNFGVMLDVFLFLTPYSLSVHTDIFPPVYIYIFKYLFS